MSSNISSWRFTVIFTNKYTLPYEYQIPHLYVRSKRQVRYQDENRKLQLMANVQFLCTPNKPWVNTSGISFTANNCALVYLVDVAGARTTSDMFHDLYENNVAETLFRQKQGCLFSRNDFLLNGGGKNYKIFLIIIFFRHSFIS